MNVNTAATQADEATRTEWAETLVPVAAPTRAEIRRTRAAAMAHRGMVTAEYAVGILAAVALGLVLLKVVTDKTVFTQLLKVVTDVIGRIGAKIPA